MSRKIFLCCLVLSLTTLACRVPVDLPQSATPGPLVTEEVHVPLPSSETISLTVQFGAGQLSLRPGAENLVDGVIRYNQGYWKPEVVVNEGTVLLKQTAPNARLFLNWGEKIRNEWDLQIGAMPLELQIEAGAYQADYEFGGLSLTNLTIRDGASDVKARFSQPNPVEMGILRYQTGASNITLTGLANANFALLEFDGGAGNYLFEFGGELRRSASVHIAAGMSNVTLVIPAGVATQVRVEGLGNVNAPLGWVQDGNTYRQEGDGPALTIVIEMGAGNVVILSALP